MSTPTIRLSEELKARIVRAAKRDGTTAHNFILEAIAEKVEQSERRIASDDETEQRFAALVASGRTIPWADVRHYLEQRIAGKPARRPATRKVAK